jgi:hypothetical protein
MRRTALVLSILLIVSASTSITAIGENPERNRVRVPVSDDLITSLLAGARPATPDSCHPSWNPPYYYLWEWAQQRCEATRCDLAEPSTIVGVGIVWFNYGTQPAEKDVGVFVLDDAGGLPGSPRWSLGATTGLLAAGETALVICDVVPPLGPVGPGPVWFGHEERAAGPPSSLFDGVIDGVHAASGPPCGGWTVQDLGDYLQVLVLAGPTEGIAGGAAGGHGPPIRLDGAALLSSSELVVDLALARPETLRLVLVAPTGRRLASLLDGEKLGAGRHRLTASTRAIASGVYFLRLEAASGAHLARKVVVVR